MCYGGSTKPGDEFLVEELMEASVYDLLHDENFPMDMEMKLDFAISTVCFLLLLSTTQKRFWVLIHLPTRVVACTSYTTADLFTAI
jgi:hypothetical protein